MSQITRCPSCATLFKVVPDQLRISDGWVRCGQCKKVFDATLSLQEAPAPAPLPPEPETVPLDSPPVASLSPWGEAAGSTDAGAGTHPEEAALPAVAETDAEAGGPSMAAPTSVLRTDESQGTGAVAVAETESAEEAGDHQATGTSSPDLQWLLPPPAEPAKDMVATAQVHQPAQEPLFSPVLTPASSVESTGELEGNGSAGEIPGGDADTDNGTHRVGGDSQDPAAQLSSHDLPAPEAGSEPSGAAPALAGEEEDPGLALPAATEPSFVRSARRKALWHRPAVRLALGGCALLLAAVLLAQVAVQQRHYLASAQPQWHPALQALCTALQCDLQPYQHIASVAVDSSSFNKLRGTTYRFALVLKNQSEVAVALPAVELTLTDTSEQPLLRRVLTPDELAAPATLPPGGEWMGSVEMDLQLAGNADARIAGYRVLAFYP